MTQQFALYHWQQYHADFSRKIGETKLKATEIKLFDSVIKVKVISVAPKLSTIRIYLLKTYVDTLDRFDAT